MKLFKNMSRDKLLYGSFIITFTILYAATAFVSWYHAITFFSIANAVWLSVLLSFVAEVGQASVLFSILLTKNKQKFLSWFVMIILTTLQIIGNVDSSYDWIIKHGGEGVKNFQESILFWMPAADPYIFKVVVAWISGALLPIIALSLTALVAQNIELRAKDELTKLDNPSSEEKKSPIEEIPISKSEEDKRTREITKNPDEISPRKVEEPVLPYYSDEEILKMNMDELDEVVAELVPTPAGPTELSNPDYLDPEIQKKRLDNLIKVEHENGLVEGIVSGFPNPDAIIEPIPELSPEEFQRREKEKEDEIKRAEEEQKIRERLKELAKERDNIKKK